MMAKKLIFIIVILLSLPCNSQTFNSSIEWGNGRYNGDVTIRSLKRVPHGSGTHEDYEGNKYIGKWSNGKKNGKGVYYFASGAKIVGNWVDGKLQGNAKYYFANGAVYNYVYKDNKAIRKTKVSGEITTTTSKKYSRRNIKSNTTATSQQNITSSSTSTSTRTKVTQTYQQPVRQRIERVQVRCSAYGCEGGTKFCTYCGGDGYYEHGRCNWCNNGRQTCVVCNGLGYQWQERIVNY